MGLSEYKKSVEDVLRNCAYRKCDSEAVRNDIVQRLTYKEGTIQLFQYRSFSEEMVKGLETGTLMFKSPMEFNDPFDSLLCWDEKVIAPYFSDEKYRKVLDKFLLISAPLVARKLSHALRICCFSEDPASPLMWAHYANEGRGICVEYELFPQFSEIICLRDGEDCVEGRQEGCKRATCKYCCERSLFPVVYSAERIDATKLLAQEIEYMVAAERGDLDKIDLSQYDSLEPYKMALFKSTDWAYEREWRIMLSGIGMNLADRYTFKMDNVKSVILGHKMNPMEEYKVGKAVARYAKLEKRAIPLYKIEVDWQSRDYTLSLVEQFTCSG